MEKEDCSQSTTCHLPKGAITLQKKNPVIPKGDTASKTISLSKKKQIQKVLSEWIKQLGGNSPKHQ